ERATVLTHGAPGPSCQVVPFTVRSGMKRIVDCGPVLEIERDGMADRRVVVPQLLIAERTRSLDVKEVAVLAVPNMPKVPQPVLSEPQGHPNRQSGINWSRKSRTGYGCGRASPSLWQFILIRRLSSGTSTCHMRSSIRILQKPVQLMARSARQNILGQVS